MWEHLCEHIFLRSLSESLNRQQKYFERDFTRRGLTRWTEPQLLSIEPPLKAQCIQCLMYSIHNSSFIKEVSATQRFQTVKFWLLWPFSNKVHVENTVHLQDTRTHFHQHKGHYPCSCRLIPKLLILKTRYPAITFRTPQCNSLISQATIHP